MTETEAEFVERMKREWDGDNVPCVEDFDQLIALARRGAAVQWRPTHRHRKRGSTYQVICEGTLQCGDWAYDYRPVTVYRAEDGTTWVRPTDEFNDGRFEALPPPPAGETSDGLRPDRRTNVAERLFGDDY